MAAHNFVDLTGQKFGHLTVLKFNKETQKWVCQCDCENNTIVEKKAGHLKLKNRIQSCGCTNKMKFIDIKGKRFGHLVAIEYCKELGEWECQCDCGNKVYKKSGHLRNNLVITCGSDCKFSKNHPKDMTKQKFTNLTVVGYNKNKLRVCKCDCGKITLVTRSNLINKKVKSCGCTNPSAFRNIENEQFSRLTPINYLGKGIWECYCECGNITKVSGYDLRNNKVKSCGCISNTSILEKELLDFISSIYTGTIERHNRTILNGQELDIYIPEKKLAIEFNGTYWHSDKFKDKYYHQQKTIDCSKQGIQLIHIFEYEWLNEDIQTKLKNHINNILHNNTNKVYARNTEIKIITQEDSNRFLNKYHLQNSVNSPINIGCFYKNELIGVMTLGFPRFNNKYDYEIHRICWLPSVNVIGGIEKVFSYFINNYTPQSIITYSDIGKFTGNSYLKIGFKPVQPNPITKPNYVWVSHHKNDIKTRYQTMKHKLIEQGLGTQDQTETEIMSSLDYYRIYDSGNIKLEWRV